MLPSNEFEYIWLDHWATSRLLVQCLRLAGGDGAFSTITNNSETYKQRYRQTKIQTDREHWVLLSRDYLWIFEYCLNIRIYSNILIFAYSNNKFLRNRIYSYSYLFQTRYSNIFVFVFVPKINIRPTLFHTPEIVLTIQVLQFPPHELLPCDPSL